MALLMGRLRYQADDLTHLDALRWGTTGAAAVFSRDDIGALAPGKQADLAMFKLDELRFSGAGDPLAALVVIGHNRADKVMIRGQWKVEDGLPIGTDLTDLMTRHSKAAHELITPHR